MLFLPAINLLQHRLADKIPYSVEVVVRVDDTNEVVVVASFDSTGDRDLGEDLLPGLW